MRQITIEPVTRIEGHARVTLQLGDDGRVEDATLHVLQLRGFEKLVEGRPLTEMPSITARICGICPVSHLLASAKACDDLLAVEIPTAAVKLRRLLNLAQYVQSHALSFFHLSSPDLLLGMDGDPALRNVIGLIEKHPEIARDGIALRRFGQNAIELLAGKRIHPAWVVAGGVQEPLTAKNRDLILSGLPAAFEIVRRALGLFKRTLDGHQAEIESFANFPTAYLSLVTEDGDWEIYDGKLCLSTGEPDDEPVFIKPRSYQDAIGEHVGDASFLKFPYYKPAGYPDGIYRVGPLARMNTCRRIGTPMADQELAELRQRAGRPATSSFYYHWARLIEALASLEAMLRVLDDPDILDDFVRARARPNRLEGVGILEAPRGTLIHHYKIDRQGQMRWANLIVATGHNNLAMSRGVLQVARRFVLGDRLEEGMLNRVEAVIRCFDPCLSCSTHALGSMPLLVQLVSREGRVVDELRRM